MKLFLITDYDKFWKSRFQKILLEFFYKSFWDFLMEYDDSNRAPVGTGRLYKPLIRPPKRW